MEQKQTYDAPDEVAEASILLANHMPLTSAQILDNLQNHIELFDKQDQGAGVWAFNAIAKILHREDYERVLQERYERQYKLDNTGPLPPR